MGTLDDVIAALSSFIALGDRFRLDQIKAKTGAIDAIRPKTSIAQRFKSISPEGPHSSK